MKVSVASVPAAAAVDADFQNLCVTLFVAFANSETMYQE